MSVTTARAGRRAVPGARLLTAADAAADTSEPTLRRRTSGVRMVVEPGTGDHAISCRARAPPGIEVVCLPDSTIRPASTTEIVVGMLDGRRRCAITIDVRPDPEILDRFLDSVADSVHQGPRWPGRG